MLFSSNYLPCTLYSEDTAKAAVDFAPVATTELVMLAQLQEEFSKRKVKLLTMSTKNNPNQNGDYTSHEQWAKDVGEISGALLPVLSLWIQTAKSRSCTTCECHVSPRANA